MTGWVLLEDRQFLKDATFVIFVISVIITINHNHSKQITIMYRVLLEDRQFLKDVTFGKTKVFVR